jgi:hypothetical protein
VELEGSLVEAAEKPKAVGIGVGHSASGG